MAYSSYNEYIVQNNLLVLVAIYAANYFASNDVPLFGFFLKFKIVKLLEWIFGLLAVYNIGYAFRGTIFPFLSSLDIPYKNLLFTPGPLVDTFMRIYNFFTTEANKPPVPKPAAPVVVEEKKDVFNSNVSEVDKKLLSLFLSNPTNERPKQSLLTPVNATTNATNPQFMSSLFQQTLFDNKNLQTKTTIENQVANSELQKLFNNITEQTPATLFASAGTAATTTTTAAAGVTTATSETLPKLKYTPCLKPPLRPAVHRERLLWYLSPTPEVIEDFKIEQMIQYKKYWHTFNDRADYDKLTEILLTKIFVPLAKSIDEYNALLATKNINVANCPPKTIALSMTVPHIGTAFNLSDIASVLNMEEYPSSDAKTYIVERIKELSSGNRMAAFRFTPKYVGMPTDAEIIMHAFKCYLSLKEPYAIPPLITQEGDVFKFLLIYIKITPELEHWGLFKKQE